MILLLQLAALTSFGLHYLGGKLNGPLAFIWLPLSGMIGESERCVGELIDW